MFCRFFKIQEAKQIKQETRNFGKIAKARAKNLRAFAIFFEVSGFLLDLLCFLNLETSTKHPHTVWQPLINERAKTMIFGEIGVPFVVRAPSSCGGCFGVGGCCLVVAMCARAGGPASRPTAAGPAGRSAADFFSRAA